MTVKQASDLAWTANYAAAKLKKNSEDIAAQFPDFTADQLLHATAASYNLGAYGFSGDPNRTDIGSTGSPKDGYGANVLRLRDCFE